MWSATVEMAAPQYCPLVAQEGGMRAASIWLQPENDAAGHTEGPTLGRFQSATVWIYTVRPRLSKQLGPHYNVFGLSNMQITESL